MAKKSKIARNEQRKVIVERYAAKRLELKKALVDANATDEAREEARLGLQKLPRNASPIRLRNRDIIDGRPRGTFQKFALFSSWPSFFFLGPLRPPFSPPGGGAGRAGRGAPQAGGGGGPPVEKLLSGKFGKLLRSDPTAVMGVGGAGCVCCLRTQ